VNSTSRSPRAILLALAIAGIAPAVHATSGTWSNTAADNNWRTLSNWGGIASIPGSTTAGSFASTEDGTFSTAGSGVINLGDFINVRTIFFGAAGGDAGAFTIGDSNDTLNLSNNGGISVGAGVTTNQTIGAAGQTINTSTTASAVTSFTNNGTGVLTLAGNIVGNNTAGPAVVNFLGTGAINLNGTFTQHATGTSNIFAGTASGSKTVLNISQNITAFDLRIGGSTGTAGSGAVYQSGGAVSLTDTTSGSGAASPDRIFSLGGDGSTGNGGYGYYTLSGASSTLSAKQMTIGARATNTIGVFDMTAGTVTATDGINIARGNSATVAGSGLLNVLGGNVNFATGNAASNLGMGATTGTAVLNVGGAGGSANVTAANASTGGINMAIVSATGTSVVNLLSNGVLTTPTITGSNAANATFLNFNGGTLKSTATTSLGSTFLTNTNVDSVVVYGAGGTIDNNGANITIGRPIAAASGNGANSNPTITNGGSGYIAPPMVTVTGTGGTGATAYATISNGAIASIIVTSPGTGYTGPLTFNLSGGGGSGAVIGTVTQTANSTTGGMTFSGGGMTTLTGTSTYGGATSINAGTVQINAGLASTSGVSVASGAAFQGQGTVGGTTTLNGSTLGNTSASNALTLGAASLAAGGNTLNLNVSGANPGIVISGALATGGNSATVNVNQTGIWANGPNNLISFGSQTGGIGAFSLGIVSGTPLSGRQVFGGLVLNGNNIALQINGDSPKWTGLDNGNWQTGSTGGNSNWKLVTAGTATDYLEGDAVLFDDSATSATTLSFGTVTIDINAANVNPLVTTFSNSTLHYTLSSSGGFGIATGILVKSGTAALTITNANSYAGGTTWSGGALNVNNAAALGTGTVTISAGNPKTLDATSGAVIMSANNAQSWNDDFTFAGSNNLDMGSGAVTVGGVGDRTVTINANTLTVGELKTAAGQGLIKQGAGTLILTSTGNNTAASFVNGMLNVAAGAIQINRTGAPDAGTTGDLVVTGLSGNGTISNGANIERWLIVSTAGTHSFTGALVDGGSGGLGLDKEGTGMLTVAGSNSFNGLMTVGGGTLILTGTNTGAGSVTVPGGILSVQSSNALGSSTVTANSRNGGVQLQGGITLPSSVNFLTSNDGTGAVPYAIDNVSGNNTINGNVTLRDGGGSTIIQSDSGALTLTGTIQPLLNIGARTLILQGASTAASTVSGTIKNNTGASDSLSVTKTGSGVWTISGNNTYTAGTTITAGKLIMAHPQALGTGGVFINGGTLDIQTDGGDTAYTLNMASNLGIPSTVIANRTTPGATITHTLGGLFIGVNATMSFIGGANVSGAANIALSGVTLSSGLGVGTSTLNPTTAILSIGTVSTSTITAKTLALAGSSSGNAVTGAISDGSNTVSLAKTGTSTWTLSGSNSYTGLTTVAGGVLNIAPELATQAIASTPLLTNSAAADGTDIQGGRVIFDYSPTGQTTPVATLRDEVIAGRVHSSASPANKALGYFDDATAMKVTALITWAGDANIDGSVNALDFNALAANYGTGSGKYWFEGDFDHDGDVDSSDFTALAQNFNQTGGIVAGALPEAPVLGALVPEPASLDLLGVLSVLGLRRRRAR
jgi:autotransporter-associated beta strand protein